MWDWLRKRGLLKPATRFELYSLTTYSIYAVLIVVGLFLFFGKSLYLGESYGAIGGEYDKNNSPAVVIKEKNLPRLVGINPARNGFCFKREAVVSGSTSTSEHEGICSADITLFTDKSFRGLSYGTYLVCSIIPDEYRRWKINAKDKRIIELGDCNEKPESDYRSYVKVVEGGRYGVTTRDGHFYILEIDKHLPIKRNFLFNTITQHESITISWGKY
jgi:hypothetical protein